MGNHPGDGDDLEVSSGPYLSWLQRVRRGLGERGWDVLIAMPADEADQWLTSLFVAWTQSPEFLEHARQREAGLPGVTFEHEPRPGRTMGPLLTYRDPGEDDHHERV